MSYLASFSQWVSQFGAIGWVLCGLIGAVIVLIVLVLFQVWQRARINNRFYRRLAEQPDAVNPLDRTFESKRVRLSELAPPAGWEIKGKTFIACEVVGPANVLLMTGNSITRMRSVFVDAILLSETGNPTNGYLVNDCTFTDCTFYNISFFVLPSQFKDFALGMVNVNWITEIPRHLVAQVLTPDQMKEWEDKRRQQSSRDELPAPQLPLEKPGRTRR